RRGGRDAARRVRLRLEAPRGGRRGARRGARARAPREPREAGRDGAGVGRPGGRDRLPRGGPRRARPRLARLPRRPHARLPRQRDARRDAGRDDARGPAPPPQEVRRPLRGLQGALELLPMRKDSPSLTAIWLAACRALGSLLPDGARLAQDAYGARFCGRAGEALLAAAGRAPPLARALILAVRPWVAYVQARTRAIDDV